MGHIQHSNDHGTHLARVSKIHHFVRWKRINVKLNAIFSLVSVRGHFYHIGTVLCRARLFKFFIEKIEIQDRSSSDNDVRSKLFVKQVNSSRKRFQNITQCENQEKIRAFRFPQCLLKDIRGHSKTFTYYLNCPLWSQIVNFKFQICREGRLTGNSIFTV